MLLTYPLQLLDELLRVASDMEVPREEGDGSPLKSSEDVMKRLCRTASASGHSMVVAEQSEEDGSLQWRLALERLLPGVLRHSSPVVSFVQVKLCIFLLFLCIVHTLNL